jgi:hypothetical protein
MKGTQIPSIRFPNSRDYSKVNRSALEAAMHGMTKEQKYEVLYSLLACLSVSTPPKRWTMALEIASKLL